MTFIVTHRRENCVQQDECIIVFLQHLLISTFHSNYIISMRVELKMATNHVTAHREEK